jgi:hypothetical protein
MNATSCGRSFKRRHRGSLARRLVFPIEAVLVLAAVLVTPVGAVTVHRSQAVPPQNFGVGIARCTFVDHSRSVLNYSSRPFRVLSASRTLVTEIRYPTQQNAGEPVEVRGAPPVARSGGYPMVVFAHGYDVTPDTYAALLDAWARAGFVVVAPIFPDESAFEVAAQHGANTEDDLANEPGDLVFVTKQVLQTSNVESSTCPILNGLVDPSEIALAGHSDGAQAVGMLAYDHGLDPQGENYASLRTGISYRSVIILSGAEDIAQSYADEASRPDLLVVQSLADQCNPARFGVHLYDAIRQPNKWFLELLTAHHLPPFDGADAPAFGVATAVTIRFLQWSLQGDVSPNNLVVVGNERPAIARMFVGANGPSLKHVAPVRESCGRN